MKNRPATLDEIVHHLRFAIRYGTRVRYRHFVVEVADRRAKLGVRHKEYDSSKITMIDGVPHVKYHGKLEPIQATYREDLGIIWDVRIKSPYLV